MHIPIHLFMYKCIYICICFLHFLSSFFIINFNTSKGKRSLMYNSIAVYTYIPKTIFMYSYISVYTVMHIYVFIVIYRYIYT